MASVSTEYSTLEKCLIECGTLLTLAELSYSPRQTNTLCLPGCKITNTPPQLTGIVVSKARIHI